MQNYIKNYQRIYKQFQPVFSPAIGEPVYFNQYGFKHLIFKGRHRRSNKIIYERLRLVPLITLVIQQCDEEIELRIRREYINGKPIKVTYYALESKLGVGGARVRVVTRKVGKNGKHYFQSVMQYKQKSA